MTLFFGNAMAAGIPGKPAPKLITKETATRAPPGQLGSGSVLEHTRAALGDPVLIGPCPDVDSGDALRQLAVELERNPTAAPAVARWLQEHPVTLTRTSGRP